MERLGLAETCCLLPEVSAQGSPVVGDAARDLLKGRRDAYDRDLEVIAARHQRCDRGQHRWSRRPDLADWQR